MWEKRERAFQKQREQEERKKFEKEMRDKGERKVEEKLRKEKEEKDRKEYEEKEIVLREVKIPHSTLLCKDIKIKLLKGVIPSLNFLSFSINYFVLVFPQNVFPTSIIISNFLKDLPKPSSDLELPFRFELSQSENYNFCEVGRISHFSKFTSPSYNISPPYLLHGLYDSPKIMFDDYCRYSFDPGGTQL